MGLSQKQTNLVNFHADVKDKVRSTSLKEPNVRGAVPPPGCSPGSQERTPACVIQFQEGQRHLNSRPARPGEKLILLPSQVL